MGDVENPPVVGNVGRLALAEQNADGALAGEDGGHHPRLREDPRAVRGKKQRLVRFALQWGKREGRCVCVRLSCVRVHSYDRCERGPMRWRGKKQRFLRFALQWGGGQVCMCV